MINDLYHSYKNAASAPQRSDLMAQLDDVTRNANRDDKQLPCVFQNLSLDNDLLSYFQSINLRVENNDGATTGKRSGVPATRRVVIPLAAGDRVRGDAVKKHVKAEYAARYCELMNVTPSHRNLALVHKMIPLESCTVSHVYDAGQGRNNIVVEPSKVEVKPSTDMHASDIAFEMLTAPIGGGLANGHATHTDSSRGGANTTVIYGSGAGSGARGFASTLQKRSPLPHASGSMASAAGQRRSSNLGQSMSVKTNPSAAGNGSPRLESTLTTSVMNGGGGAHGADASSLTPEATLVFEHYKSELVFPFNLEDKHAPKSVMQLDWLDRLTMERTAAVNANFEFAKHEALNTAIQKELACPSVACDQGDIIQYISRFVQGFPWSQLKDRISQRTIHGIQTSLRSPIIVDTCYKLTRLLYASYLRPFAPSVLALTQSQQEQLFLDIAEAFCLQIRCPEGIDHALRLLCIRAIVRAELAAKYPLFFACHAGRNVRTTLDALITAIGDPTGLVSRISVFESTPRSLRLIRNKRLPRKDITHYRSPMMVLLLDPTASSVTPDGTWCPEIVELKRFVTPRIRERLLEIIKSIPS